MRKPRRQRNSGRPCPGLGFGGVRRGLLTGCDQPPPPPQALASGAGANSQHAIWISIIGGMLASTLVASLFVPLFFVLL